MEAFRKAKEEGMIHFIGLTSHHNSVLLDLVKTGDFDTVMFPFNVIERDAEPELIPLAQSLNIGMIVMKPLAGGAIRNRSKAFRFFNNFPVDVILTVQLGKCRVLRMAVHNIRHNAGIAKLVLGNEYA